MRCTIENKYVKGLMAIATMPNLDDEETDSPEHYIRIAVTADGVRISSPFGEMKAESRVSEPGVLFIPVSEFVNAISAVRTNHYFEVSASSEKIRITGRMLVPEICKFAYFENAETAPTHWSP